MINHVLYLSLLASVVASEDIDPNDCGCFLTNGSTPTFYSEHMFYDFRSLSEHAGVPKVETSSSESALSPPTSDYFDQDNWTNVWEIQGWDNKNDDGSFSSSAKFLMVNSPNNVYIQENDDENAASDTFLTLRTKRLPKFQSAAEIESLSGDYRFVSLRVLARTIGSPGACTAVFTYRDSRELADIQEADIEILTSGPRNKIQYTNQPSYSDDGESFPEATKNASMPNGLKWTDWTVHRLDWTPERSIWYVNGEETASIEFQTPRDASHIHLNTWSDGGSWSGVMPTYDEAYLQIQWIEMVYNTTDVDEDKKQRRAEDKQCTVVCSIDEHEAGTATVMWESVGLRAMGVTGGRVFMWYTIILGIYLSLS